MYGEETFLEITNALIKFYKNTGESSILKQELIEKFKELGKIHWIDEELVQDKINELC